MMALKITAGQYPQVIEIRRELFLNDCYTEIGCDFIETLNVHTNVGRMMIVCDDESLLRDRVPEPSLALAERGIFIYGTCLVFGYDPRRPDDPFTDLPPETYNYLMKSPILVV